MHNPLPRGIYRKERGGNLQTTFYFSGCTVNGFVSHGGALSDETKCLTILKGGSGCGKSTFMRAIGRAAEAKGLDVEYLLCSSDPDSLDGVLLPTLSAGFVDGTAPHVLEPKLCGGSMNYLNFGDFYDHAAMRPNEEEILAAQRKNRACYPCVTACLSAADRLLDCVRQEAQQPNRLDEVDAIGQCLALSTLKPVGERPQVKRRFLSNLTPRGLRLCAQTPSVLCERVYVLRDHYGLAPFVLRVLEEKAIRLGHTVYRCHSPFFPDEQATHLLIPTAQAAFVSERRELPYDAPCFCRIDLDSTLPPQARKELAFCLATASTLVHRAVEYLQEAKRYHDRIEQLCRPFVNFSAVDALTAQTLRRLF